MAKSTPSFEFNKGGYPQQAVFIILSGMTTDHSLFFAMLFMQHWGKAGETK